MDIKVVGLASDHAGFVLKKFVKQYLTEKGIPFKDYGTNSEESCDYPDFAHALAQGIEKGCIGSGQRKTIVNASVTAFILFK